MSRAALSHAVNGFFDSFRSKSTAPAVAAQPASRASRVRVESRYNEGDDESLLESATSLPRPTLKALEKAIRADGFKGALVSGWGQGERGGFTVRYGGEEYEFEISENVSPRPTGEIGRLVKASGRYERNASPYTSIRELPPGADRAVAYSEARALVSYLPYLGTPYDVTKASMSGTVEIGFSELADARKFFDKAKRSGAVERAELLFSASGRGRGSLVDEFSEHEPNGRRSGILSDGTRVNAYQYGDEWTAAIHYSDGGYTSFVMSGAGAGEFDVHNVEGPHMGRAVPWDAVPSDVRSQIEQTVAGDASMVANARRKKGVTVDDLPISGDSKVLACPDCGSEFSAAKGDYFQIPKGEVLACEHCEVPLQLRARKLPPPSQLDESAIDDDYVLAIVDRDGAIGLFRVERGQWRNADPLAVGYRLDQVSDVAERDARARGVQDAVIWDAELDRQVGHVLRGRWIVEEEEPVLARNASMNDYSEQDAFVRELQSTFDPVAVDRQLFFRFRVGALHITYVNLPKGAGSGGGGAEAQNNRMDFDVDGFAQVNEDQWRSPKTKGLVKIEQSTTFDRSRKLRAKTGKPAVIARYLADYLANFAREVPPRFTHTRR